MRINAITVTNGMNYQNPKRNASVRKLGFQSEQPVQSPNFKGWGGVLGTIGGAIVGGVLTVASGGALAWTVPVLSGTAAIGGDIYEHKDKPSSSELFYED